MSRPLAAAGSHDLKLVSAALLAVIVIGGLAVAWRHRAFVIATVKAYFTEAGSAYNLAVFRLIFYATAFALAALPENQVLHFAKLPRSLMFPPWGTETVAGHIPLSPDLARAAFIAVVVSSALAAIGLLTRLASIVFLVAMTYYLTLPQLFGKVDHYHIVLWVAAVLAFSPTADAFSVDSLIRSALRRDGRTLAVGLPRDVAYSRPLRLTWLFIAIGYLGPGLWKYRTAGLEWASASNMRAIMYDKWYEIDGYRPFVPIQKVGLFLTIGALGTMMFETGFVFLIWHRYTRPIAAVMGIFFHSMTILLLQISFYSTQILYVSFVNWEWLSRRVMRNRAPLIFAFDGGCGICRKTAAGLSRNTLPGGVEYVSAQEGLRSGRLPADADLSRLLTDIHLFTPDAAYVGYVAYRRLAWRTPLFWPVLPFLYLAPVRAIGERIYRRVADGRSCQVGEHELSPTVAPLSRAWVYVPTAIAALVIAVAGTAAIENQVNGWPVALYPTFAGLHDRVANQIIVVRTSAGRQTRVSLNDCLPWMPSPRYNGLVSSTIQRAEAGDVAIFRSLLSVARESPTCTQIEGGGSLTFIQETVETTPGVAGRVIERKVLYAAHI
jgi:predicted DCC family thiol-disulfide oxidoreductase YuxK